MESKRTELIGVKVSQETKEKLEEIASEKKWKLSFLCNEIITDYIRRIENKKSL